MAKAEPRSITRRSLLAALSLLPLPAAAAPFSAAAAPLAPSPVPDPIFAAIAAHERAHAASSASPTPSPPPSRPHGTRRAGSAAPRTRGSSWLTRRSGVSAIS